MRCAAPQQIKQPDKAQQARLSKPGTTSMHCRRKHHINAYTHCSDAAHMQRGATGAETRH
jgi:hypothetical protein